MATTILPQIQTSVSEFVAKPRKMLIGDKWVDAVSGKTFELAEWDGLDQLLQRIRFRPGLRGIQAVGLGARVGQTGLELYTETSRYAREFEQSY